MHCDTPLRSAVLEPGASLGSPQSAALAIRVAGVEHYLEAAVQFKHKVKSSLSWPYTGSIPLILQ